MTLKPKLIPKSNQVASKNASQTEQNSYSAWGLLDLTSSLNSLTTKMLSEPMVFGRCSAWRDVKQVLHEVVRLWAESMWLRMRLDIKGERWDGPSLGS